jgi:hypothetical protein
MYLETFALRGVWIEEAAHGRLLSVIDRGLRLWEVGEREGTQRAGVVADRRAQRRQRLERIRPSRSRKAQIDEARLWRLGRLALWRSLCGAGAIRRASLPSLAWGWVSHAHLRDKIGWRLVIDLASK